MYTEISQRQEGLKAHPVYSQLTSLENIRIFMQYHVFAVWDFMSLLKSLQKEITCVSIPWTDSQYDPELVRLINEIVLGEESDVDQFGNPSSHFALYIKAMNEIGADTSLIENFLRTMDLNKLPKELAAIVSFHLDVAMNGKVHEVASSFFYGREKLIPEMFQSILDVLYTSQVDCPTLKYYFERHIEVDGEDHGPKALKCLKHLMDTPEKEQEAIEVAQNSLANRWKLWSFIESNFLTS